MPELTITNEDCMDLMSRYDDNHFELAIVDPPYGIGLDMVCKNGSSGKQLKQSKGKTYDSIHENKSWNNSPPTPEYFKELHRVSVNQIIWGCNYYAKYIPAVGRIVHDKETGLEGTKINYSHGDLASCSLQKRITFCRYRWSGNKQGAKVNWMNTGPDARIHPTQKPIALYRWLLDNYAKEGNNILDTHLGSGSIAVACYYMGYGLTACELDTDYYNLALERVEKCTKEIDLFDSPDVAESKPTQCDLFDLKSDE